MTTYARLYTLNLMRMGLYTRVLQDKGKGAVAEQVPSKAQDPEPEKRPPLSMTMLVWVISLTVGAVFLITFWLMFQLMENIRLHREDLLNLAHVVEKIKQVVEADSARLSVAQEKIDEIAAQTQLGDVRAKDLNDRVQQVVTQLDSQKESLARVETEISRFDQELRDARTRISAVETVQVSAQADVP